LTPTTTVRNNPPQEEVEMMRVNGLAAVAVSFGLFPAVLPADVIASSSLALDKFQIVPSAGSLQVLSTNGFQPSWCVSAAVEDTVNGGASQFESCVASGPLSAHAATTLAAGDASASFPPVMLSASGSVDIPNATQATAFVVGGGDGTLAVFTESFEIVGAISPVSVRFSASLTGNQSWTTRPGQLASSEIVYDLNIDSPTSIPIFHVDSALFKGGTGPDNLSSPYSNTLVKSEMLVPNQVYFLQTDVIVSAGGNNMVPEPASLTLTGLGVCMLLITAGCRLRSP
jgi:hypothetical protein